MALLKAVVGATHTGQEITWLEQGGATPHVLTGATITGRIEDANGTGRDITGTLTITDATGGVFTWAYSAADVQTEGVFKVQFKATYSGGKFDRTFFQEWIVSRAL
jgi:hypothetical protein